MGFTVAQCQASKGKIGYNYIHKHQTLINQSIKEERNKMQETNDMVIATRFYKSKEAQSTGEYKPTGIDEAKAKADILIEYANGGSFTIKLQRGGIKLGKQGVKHTRGNVYEVTANKLKKLQSTYDVKPNF